MNRLTMVKIAKVVFWSRTRKLWDY